MVMLSGSRSVNCVPAPTRVSSVSSPPSSPTVTCWTMSTPSPRPLVVVGRSIVDSPGMASSASSPSDVVGVGLPARRATAAASMPRPSSATVSSSWLLLRSKQVTRISPSAGLPARARSSGGSMA